MEESELGQEHVYPDGLKVWSHLRPEQRVIQDLVPGHELGCQGDCDKWGCPVPVPVERLEMFPMECGEVRIYSVRERELQQEEK